jgi:predicted ArsR family transcriptional regulator
LAAELAHQVQRVLPDAEASGLFFDGGQRLARQISQEWPADPLSRRRKALDALEQRGYFPSWEDDRGGLRLQLRNCPYASAAIRCPTLCAFDTGLLCGLMACTATADQSIARGDPFCQFHLSVDSLSAFRIK